MQAHLTGDSCLQKRARRMYLSKNQTSGANPSLKCAVERKWNLDSFASLSRSLKAISRRNRPSRLFLRRRFLTPVFVHISCVSNALACCCWKGLSFRSTCEGTGGCVLNKNGLPLRVLEKARCKRYGIFIYWASPAASKCLFNPPPLTPVFVHISCGSNALACQ